jgi:hypothetical protein
MAEEKVDAFTKAINALKGGLTKEEMDEVISNGEDFIEELWDVISRERTIMDNMKRGCSSVLSNRYLFHVGG